MHATIGVVSICATHHLTEVSWRSIAVMIASIGYVSWAAGRLPGVIAAAIAGAFTASAAFDHFASSTEAMIVAAFGVSMYVAVAFSVAVVETATRPRSDDRGSRTRVLAVRE